MAPTGWPLLLLLAQTSSDWRCEPFLITVRPPAMRAPGAETFATWAASEMRKRFPAASAQPRLRWELQLVDFREARLTRNLPAMLGGGLADPGRYRLQIRVLDLESGEELIRHKLESSPSLRQVFFGNGLSRQSTMRGGLRRQFKRLHDTWLAKPRGCIKTYR